ncbi:MAG: hypothetical protein KF865_05825 [Bdellovibrionaceae bacterium]|nr:hypothetical protein [Pseudobdellovibrionaceae bacterium]
MRMAEFEFLSAVHHFIDQICDLNEADYGDFMRAANLYLLNLRAQVGDDESSARTIDHMREYVQFHPDWDVLDTKKRLLRDAQHLRDEIARRLFARVGATQPLSAETH